MQTEPLVDGGHLVRVHGGSGLAVEGVIGACRGMIVTSALAFRDGGAVRAGRYRLTKRIVADLWRVRRITAR